MSHATDAVTVRTSVDIPIAIPGSTIGEGDGGRGPLQGRLSSFHGLGPGVEHVAIALGPREQPIMGVPLVRVHSERLTGDVFGSLRCDCGPQLREAMQEISTIGGYVLYLRQEGRGIGLYSKIDAYQLQSRGLDTFEANRALGFADDERHFEVAARMLVALGVDEVDLMTNNPAKVEHLIAGGVIIRRRVPTRVYRIHHNAAYLEAKADSGHVIDPSRGPRLETF